MDHKVSKDMISSGMIPSGEKTQADLGRTQYGSAPSPSSLMDAYKSIYEHHQKDKDGNTIPHEGEQLNEGKMPEGLKNYLMKKKGKKEDKKDMKEENLDERRGSSVQQLAQNRKDAFTQKVSPQRGMGGGTGNPTNRRGSGAKPNPFSKPATPPQKGYGGGVGNPTQKRGSGLISRITSKIGSLMNNDVDLFDLVKGELIDEGYEEKEALKIMANMTKEEFDEISEGLAGMALKLGGLAAGAYGVKKAAEKLGTMSGTPKTPPAPKKPGLIQKLKDRRDATNKAIEQM